MIGKKEFYNKCAEILGVEYVDGWDDQPRWSERFQVMRTTSRTRWSGREPGNGRYPGFGIIRDFGTTVHVSLHQPIAINKGFPDRQSVIDFLENLMDGRKSS